MNSAEAIKVLNSDDPELLESLAQRSQQLTCQYFGRTISLYTPLYISNYCENQCVYCGFNAGVKIERKKLDIKEIEDECKALSGTGIQNILILTGESRENAPLSYIIEAVKTAKKYFPNIGVEILPLDTNEYKELYEAGVDGVTLYQETYDQEIYQKLHLSGKKTDFQYRYRAPERIAQAGIRYISMGVLLGLAPWQDDILALFEHLRYMEKNYPGVEYSLSFPRLQKASEEASVLPVSYTQVSDQDMIKIISLARQLFPRIGINLSTRESASFRDNVLGFGVTRMSAGSSTTVGGYTSSDSVQAAGPEKDKQFSINDERSVQEVRDMLIAREFDPIWTDWRNI